MTCKQCKGRNPVGNKFCRECGAPLTPPEGSLEAEEAARAEAERRREQGAALLADAFGKSERKAYAEALPLAEEAATLMPDSTSAHAMLSTLYERLDRNDEAIAAMERVVELNPDSAADRERLEKLRRGIHVPPVAAPEARQHPIAPYLPMVAAGSVAALVLLIGLSILHRGQTASSATAVAETGPAVESAAGLQEQQRPYLAPTDSRDDPFAPLAPSAPHTAPHLSALPRPTENAALAAPAAPRRFVPPAPVTVPESVTRGSGDSGGAGSLPPLGAGETASGGFGSGGRISVAPPSGANAAGNTTGDANTQEAPSPPSDALPPGSYIKIKVGTPPSPERGAGRGAPDAGAASSLNLPIENPMARARQLQGAGRYREAITAYRDALSAGAAAGEVHEGIAQSYERLGDNAAARSAYRDALHAYEAQAASGKNADAAQRGIATCKAALEVLGG